MFLFVYHIVSTAEVFVTVCSIIIWGYKDIISLDLLMKPSFEAPSDIGDIQIPLDSSMFRFVYSSR